MVLTISLVLTQSPISYRSDFWGNTRTALGNNNVDIEIHDKKRSLRTASHKGLILQGKIWATSSTFRVCECVLQKRMMPLSNPIPFHCHLRDFVDNLDHTSIFSTLVTPLNFRRMICERISLRLSLT